MPAPNHRAFQLFRWQIRDLLLGVAFFAVLEGLWFIYARYASPLGFASVPLVLVYLLFELVATITFSLLIQAPIIAGLAVVIFYLSGLAFDVIQTGKLLGPAEAVAFFLIPHVVIVALIYWVKPQ